MDIIMFHVREEMALNIVERKKKIDVADPKILHEGSVVVIIVVFGCVTIIFAGFSSFDCNVLLIGCNCFGGGGKVLIVYVCSLIVLRLVN